MKKLEVGDKVRILNSWGSSLKVGSEHYIDSSYGDIYHIDKYDFSDRHLELVENKTSLNKKDTNPKDAIGVEKVPMSVLSSPVMLEAALGMFEGAVKYGRHNYRVVGVRAGVYYDATMRHLMSWWEGQDIDEDSGLSHVTKAIASLMVLRDAMIQDKLNDDRPPKTLNQSFINDYNKQVKEILKKYPNTIEPYTELNEVKKNE